MKAKRAMGRVIAKIKLTNYLEEELKGLKLLKGQPRSVQTEALVDTGATGLHLQSRLIRALGLKCHGFLTLRTAKGRHRFGVYQPVSLELMGRQGHFDVVKVADDVPNLLGQVPLEVLDFVVDPKRERLIPNPEHGGRHMMELF